MNLHFAQYYNIGPFRNKLININFKDGKYLIKAPIGSGKSFLFFDAPFFGLYGSNKYKQRNILNKKSQEGFVRLIFSIGEEDNKSFYLVDRVLKATRSGGESVQTRLFSLMPKEEINFDLLNDKILTIEDKDVGFGRTFLSVYNEFFSKLRKFFDIEEIRSKSSTEIQKLIDNMIPPKEVFLSTSFLMQDSDNIFELTPSERINIFKNIFNLVGIDEVRDLLADKKKELNLQIKVLSSEDKWVSKFQRIKSDLLEIYKRLNFIEEDLTFELISGGISRPFEFDFAKYWNFINERKSKLDTILKEQNILNQQKFNLQTKKESYLQQLEKLKDKLEEKKELLNRLDKTLYESLKEEYLNIKNEIAILLKTYLDIIPEDKKNIFKEQTFEAISKFFDNVVYEGKQLRSKVDNLKLQKENFHKEYKVLTDKLRELSFENGSKYWQLFVSEKENLQLKLKSKIQNIQIKIDNLLEQKEEFERQKNDLLFQIKDLESIISKELNFYCKEIGRNCPFVKDIKKDQLVQIENQLNKLKTKLNMIEKRISTIIQNINELETEKKQIESKLQSEDTYEDIKRKYLDMLKEEKEKVEKQLKELNYENKIKQIESQIKDLEMKLEDKRKLLYDLSFSKFKSYYERYLNLQKKLNEVERQLLEFENKFKNIGSLETEIASLQTEILKINQFLNEIIDEERKILIRLSQLEKEKKEIFVGDIEEIEQLFKQFETLFLQWKSLYKEYKESQLEVEKLKEEYKIVSDLYNIFSKELMLVVLDDFLPILFEVINSYLSKVVDFQLKHELKKKGKDKLELEIFVVDDKGERNVKSLSGGQKTVLKLAWILAIAKVVNPKFLFLDETINNLDYEAIGRVADMIEDFVEQSNVKFYVVTHSKQIQDMNIWDDIITI